MSTVNVNPAQNTINPPSMTSSPAEPREQMSVQSKEVQVDIIPRLLLIVMAWALQLLTPYNPLILLFLLIPVSHLEDELRKWKHYKFFRVYMIMTGVWASYFLSHTFTNFCLAIACMNCALAFYKWLLSYILPVYKWAGGRVRTPAGSKQESGLHDDVKKPLEKKSVDAHAVKRTSSKLLVKSVDDRVDVDNTDHSDSQNEQTNYKSPTVEDEDDFDRSMYDTPVQPTFDSSKRTRQPSVSTPKADTPTAPRQLRLIPTQSNKQARLLQTAPRQ